MTNLHAKWFLHRNKIRPIIKGGGTAGPGDTTPEQSTDATGSKSKGRPARRLAKYRAKVIAAMAEQLTGRPGGVQFKPQALAFARRVQTVKYFKALRRPQVRVLADLERGSDAIEHKAIRKLVEVEVVRVLSNMAQPQSPASRNARERGLAYARAEYEKREHLSLAQASAQVSLSERIINERHNTGRYYALVLEGNTRGFRFPEWQFGVKQERLAQVLDVMREAQASCWMMHHFLIAPNSLLGNMTPRDYLLDADRPLDHLVNIMRGRFTSDQGAG